MTTDLKVFGGSLDGRSRTIIAARTKKMEEIMTSSTKLDGLYHQLDLAERGKHPESILDMDDEDHTDKLIEDLKRDIAALEAHQAPSGP